MSYQPKPTAGAPVIKMGEPIKSYYPFGDRIESDHDQPKPTTSSCAEATQDKGEWTVEKVEAIYQAGINYPDKLKAVADAHNAALSDAKTLAYAKGAQDQHGEDKLAQQPLVDELTRMSFSYLATADELRQMARDALAKLKEGK